MRRDIEVKRPDEYRGEKPSEAVIVAEKLPRSWTPGVWLDSPRADARTSDVRNRSVAAGTVANRWVFVS